jgi:hypothetical protein
VIADLCVMSAPRRQRLTAILQRHAGGEQFMKPPIVAGKTASGGRGTTSMRRLYDGAGAAMVTAIRIPAPAGRAAYEKPKGKSATTPRARRDPDQSQDAGDPSITHHGGDAAGRRKPRRRVGSLDAATVRKPRAAIASRLRQSGPAAYRKKMAGVMTRGAARLAARGETDVAKSKSDEGQRQKWRRWSSRAPS